MKVAACVITVFFVPAFVGSLQAQFSVGTWVQTAPMKGLTMNVDQCCNGGRRLTFHLTIGQKTQTVTVESRFDGSDAPQLVDGKPTGETMALKRVDERRTTTVFKRNGKVFRTSTTTESADRMTMIVENEFLDSGDGRVTGKMTETYVRK